MGLLRLARPEDEAYGLNAPPGFLNDILGAGAQPQPQPDLTPLPVQQAPLSPVEAPPAPDASSFIQAPKIDPTPEPPKQPGFLSRLGSVMLGTDDRGATFGDRMLAASMGLRGDVAAEGNFLQGIGERTKKQKLLDTEKASLKARNAAVLDAMVTDPKTGRRTVDRQRLSDNLKTLAEPVDLASIKSAIDGLSSSPLDIVSGPRGISAVDTEAGTVKSLQKNPVAPIPIKLPNGKTGYLQPDDEGDTPPAGQGVQAPSSVPASAPPPAPPTEGPDPEAVWQNMIRRESGGRAGVTGPQTVYGRAQGLTQVLPKTAQAMASKLGIPYRPELMTAQTPEGAAYQEQIGRAYYDEGLAKFGGDPQKAALYYHGGPDQRLWGPKTHAYADAVAGPKAMVGMRTAQGAGTPAAATAADPGADMPPPPRGFRWAMPPSNDEEWRMMTPDEAASRHVYSGLKNINTGDEKLGEKIDKAAGGPGKMNAPQTKQVNESLYSLGVASSINARLDKSLKQLDTGLLNPSFVNNIGSWIAGTTGVSTPQQRAFNSFRSDLEKLRNDSLRLNKGVQTEGDAERAWNEILTHLNDPKYIRERLTAVEGYNQQAIDLHKALVQQNREDAGMSPIDFSRFESKPLAEKGGGGGQGGTKYEVGKVYPTNKGNLRKTKDGWETP